MGQAKSRRGASAAAAPESSSPSRQRRRGKRARAAGAFAGEAGTGSPSGNAARQNKTPCVLHLELRSVQVEPAGPVHRRTPVRLPAGPRTDAGGDPGPKSRILAFAGLNGEWITVSGHDASRPGARPGRTRVVGPSLRQDIPRPPLRLLLLRTRRNGRLAWQHGRDRAYAIQRELRRRVRAGVARTVAYVIARLDAWIWQPVTWPFRPAQREMLARTMAALSVAVVAAGWIAAYNTLAPATVIRPPAPPPAQPKPFAGRVVSDALPVFEAPADAVPMVVLPTADGSTIEVPLPVPPPHLRRPRPPVPRLL